MKAVLLPVEGDPSEIDVADWTDIRKAIGGWLEIAPTPGAPFTMYVDEEGKMRGRTYNPRADRLANRYRNWKDPLVGDVVLVGRINRAGDDTPFTMFDYEGLMS